MTSSKHIKHLFCIIAMSSLLISCETFEIDMIDKLPTPYEKSTYTKYDYNTSWNLISEYLRLLLRPDEYFLFSKEDGVISWVDNNKFEECFYNKTNNMDLLKREVVSITVLKIEDFGKSARLQLRTTCYHKIPKDEKDDYLTLAPSSSLGIYENRIISELRQLNILVDTE